jgi:hypothetical protein
MKGSVITLGLEYKPSDKSYIRIETNSFNFGDDYKLFLDSDKKPTNSRMELLLNFGVWFD